MRRRLVVAGLTVSLLLGTAGDALAANWKTWKGMVYEDLEDGCTYLDVRMSDQNKPWVQSLAGWYGREAGTPNNCAEAAIVAVPNSVVVRQDVYVYNTWLYGNRWVLCNQGPWVYNIGTAASAQTGFGWVTPPCGPGHYTAHGAGFINTPYGEMKGGWRKVNGEFYFS